MKHLPLRECGFAIAVLLGFLLLYGGTYFAMMLRDERISGIMIGGRIAEPSVRLEYRFGGEWSRSLFEPAHEIDRRLRPDLWRNELIRVSKISKRSLRPVMVEIRDPEESP
jgi:hypothetical protein